MSAFTAQTSIEVVGVKEALRELNKIDKQARRQLTKDYREAVAPVVNTAKSYTPAQPPLSGMGYRWQGNGTKPIFPYQGGAVDKTIKPFISGKKPRTFNGYTSHLATFGIRWSSPAAQVVEMAGKGSVPTARGRQMVEALTARFGEPGRFLWKAYAMHARQVQANVQNLIEDVMAQINRKLK